MSAPNQRKTYTPDRRINGELDQIYKDNNAYPSDKKISKDYTATLQDSNISFMQSGLTLTLPQPGQAGDQFTLFMIDKSNSATASPQSIITVDDTGSFSISSNLGFLTVRWDASLNTWYKVG